MRLYVNTREIDALKEALRNAKPKDEETRVKQIALLERVVLCEQLQANCNRADATN